MVLLLTLDNSSRRYYCTHNRYRCPVFVLSPSLDSRPGYGGAQPASARQDLEPRSAAHGQVGRSTRGRRGEIPSHQCTAGTCVHLTFAGRAVRPYRFESCCLNKGVHKKRAPGRWSEPLSRHRLFASFGTRKSPLSLVWTSVLSQGAAVRLVRGGRRNDSLCA